MFARTERLLLRPGWSEDAPALFRASADEGIVRNLAHAPWPYRPEDAEAFVARERREDEPAMLVFLMSGAAPELIAASASQDARGRDPSSAIGCTAALGPRLPTEAGAPCSPPDATAQAEADRAGHSSTTGLGTGLEKPASARPGRYSRVQRRPPRDRALPRSVLEFADGEADAECPARSDDAAA